MCRLTLVVAAALVFTLLAPHAWCAPPDLVVKIRGPATGESGQPLTGPITVDVINQGDATATGTIDAGDGYMVDVVLSTDESAPVKPATVDTDFREDVLFVGGRISRTRTLKAGASTSYTLPGMKIPNNTPSGKYYLGAVVDSTLRIKESVETNNTGFSPIRIGSLVKLPDLVVRCVGPTEARSGETVRSRVTVVVMNAGDAPATGTLDTSDGGFMVDIVLSKNNDFPVEFATYSEDFHEDVLIQGARFSRTRTLAPRGRVVLTLPELKIPNHTPPGTYYLGAVVDPGKAIDESDESNNTFGRPIKITGGTPEPDDPDDPDIDPGGMPDLTVSRISLLPRTPSKGRRVLVNVGVQNRGTAPSGAFSVQWWPGENYTSPGHTWRVSGLAAGGSQMLRCVYDGYPSHYASINTKAVADSGGEVAESNETNNDTTMSISVRQR